MQQWGCWYLCSLGTFISTVQREISQPFFPLPTCNNQTGCCSGREGRCPTESCWGRGWSRPCGGRCQQRAEVSAQHLRGGEEDRWHRSFTLKLVLFGEMSEKHNFPAGPSGRDFAGCRARHIRQHHPAGGALASAAAGAEVMVLAMTAPELTGFFSLSCLIGVSLNCVQRCLFRRNQWQVC